MKSLELSALCFFVILGTGGATSHAQAAATAPTAKRPMTFADLMAMKRVSDPQISPSGKWVMFSVTDVSLEKNTKTNHLWVVPMSGGSEKQITFGEGESSGRFSPDGKWVSMTMKDQVYLAPWDEAAGKVGEVKALTPVPGGADGAIWSPDSKRLMFTAQVYPECSVKGGDEALKRLEPADGKAVIGGSLKPETWKGLEPSTWADEEACVKAKDEAADKNPVKATVFDGLLYRHWEHWTGQKRTHIFVVDQDGKNVRDLTPANEVGDAETPTFFVGGPQEYAWAPDGKEIAYVTNLDPVPAASTNNDVFTLRLGEPGAKAVKVSTAAGSDDEPAYSPDGKWLAWRSQARSGFESDLFRLVVMDRGTKAIRDLMPKWDRWVDEFVWAPDSRAIYFVSGNLGQQSIFDVVLSGEWPMEFAATIYPRFANGEVSKSVSAEFAELNISRDGKTLVASGMMVNSPVDLYRFSLTDFPPQILHEPSSLENWVLQNGGHTSGAKAVLVGFTTLTRLNRSILGEIDAPALEPFWFEGATGDQVEGFLLRPPKFDPAKKYPVKFLMHGGPQTAWGDAWSYRWNWELMAASGYVVIGINRRGSTGYGQKFVDEVSGDWGGRAYEDLMKGLDYAEAHYPFLDKDRECALGASYGGFMANWVLTHTNRFKCIVTHDGMYDPVSAWGATEEMWFNEWEFRRPEDFPKGWDGFSAGYNPMGHVNPTHRDEAAMNGAPKVKYGDSGRAVQNDAGKGERDGHAAEPWRYENLPADQDPFRKWSPMRFIANAKTPTLIIHSQKDMRLDVSQGFEMFTALQRLGVPSKMLYFPDEGHWVLKPQNSQLWNEVVSDWCDKWTHSGKYAENQ